MRKLTRTIEVPTPFGTFKFPDIFGLLFAGIILIASRGLGEIEKHLGANILLALQIIGIVLIVIAVIVIVYRYLHKE
jgi:hypothetical protein